MLLYTCKLLDWIVLLSFLFNFLRSFPSPLTGFDRGYGPEGALGKKLAKERSRNPITAALMAHDNEEHPIGHSTVSLLYYPWFAPIEASDAWKRRPKPSFGTVKFYIHSLFDHEEAKPTCQVKV